MSGEIFSKVTIRLVMNLEDDVRFLIILSYLV